MLNEWTGILPAQVGGDGPGIPQSVGGLIHQTQVGVPTVPQGQVPVEHHRLQLHVSGILQEIVGLLGSA